MALKGNRLIASFFYTHPDILIKVVWDVAAGPKGSIPDLRVRVKRTDMVYVVKVKLERALANVAPAHAVSADELELEHRGQVLKETKALDVYSVTEGSEILASFCQIPSEQDLVAVLPHHHYLDQLMKAKPGVPSSGGVKQIVSQYGFDCQVCWRRRWFRCHILRIYPTSMLVAWHDWPEAEWPHFFLNLRLAAVTGAPPLPGDEMWRVRWHTSKSLNMLPVVEPLFAQLPPILWLRAVLRVYALADEKQMLQEVQDHLPAELAAAARAPKRHVVVVLGDSGVGKTTLINCLCAGPPEDDADATDDDGADANGTRRARVWPTVAPRTFHTQVSMPGGAPPVDFEVWDTSGRERFKGLSSAFYRKAHSCLLVFDVKSQQSFAALGKVGGWRDEFARMTGASPHGFPFVLVGNKAETDLTADRRVFEDDVRDWCHGEGGVMPYIETSFVGNPTASYRHAQLVFRTLARADQRSEDNFGRYRPPDTVRVPPEEKEEGDAVEKVFKSLGKSFRQTAAQFKGEVDAFFAARGRPDAPSAAPARPPAASGALALAPAASTGAGSDDGGLLDAWGDAQTALETRKPRQG